MGSRKLTGIVLDVDGVLIHGKKAIQCGIDALKLLRRSSTPFMLCTNGGGCTEATKALQLSKILGCEIKESEVCVAHTPFKMIAAEYYDKEVLVIGRGEIESKEVAISYGLNKYYTIEDIARAYNTIHWQATSIQDGNEVPDGTFINKISAVLMLIDPSNWSLDIQASRTKTSK